MSFVNPINLLPLFAYSTPPLHYYMTKSETKNLDKNKNNKKPCNKSIRTYKVQLKETANGSSITKNYLYSQPLMAQLGPTALI